MTAFTFVRRDGSLWGFTVVGHSGYAEAGGDIVCAAVSSAVRMCCNGITEIAGLPAGVTVREMDAAISLLLPQDLMGERKALGGLLLQSLLLEAQMLSEEYPDHIKVMISEMCDA